MGATTSVQDSGLLDELVRQFEDVSNYDVKPIVGGSGQTLETARQGEFDVIMTHSPADEDKFIADGEGIDKRIVMRNFFLIAGPESVPTLVHGRHRHRRQRDAADPLHSSDNRLGPPTAFAFNDPTRKASGVMGTEKAGGRVEKAVVREAVYQGGMSPRCEGMGTSATST